MNSSGYALLVICALAILCDKETRLYYGAFGLLMLGHYHAVWIIPAEYYDLAYLSSAGLCAFLVLCLPKSRESMFLSLVCCACVMTNILGYALWDASANIAVYDDLYYGIYLVTILYLIKKAWHGRINKALAAARHVCRNTDYSSTRHMGQNK